VLSIEHPPIFLDANIAIGSLPFPNGQHAAISANRRFGNFRLQQKMNAIDLIKTFQGILKMERCPWATKNELDAKYHDEEWGVPLHDDRLLFEFLILEGAQAGLSWSTILAKRDHYRKAFANFDAAKVAKFNAKKIEALVQDVGIVRNRLKVAGTVKNATAFLAVQKEFGSFDKYIWSFVGGRPIQNKWAATSQVPSKTEISDAMSRDLKKRGFTFVGSTICYAFMQAAGMVNDHLVDCPRHAVVKNPAVKNWL
jgi:DNA-3-methyladenine glycosylase I